MSSWTRTRTRHKISDRTATPTRQPWTRPGPGADQILDPIDHRSLLLIVIAMLRAIRIVYFVLAKHMRCIMLEDIRDQAVFHVVQLGEPKAFGYDQRLT